MIHTNDRGDHHHVVGALSDSWFRMCIPPKFPVKSLVFQLMSSQVGKMRSAEREITISDIRDMQALLAMADEVLETESYLDYDQLDTFGDQSPADLVCGSCGGEILLTVFSCKGACATDGKTGAPAGEKMIICPLCFVDGRTCNCAEMRPIRVREIGPLEEIRSEAYSFIREEAADFMLSEGELDSTEGQSILTAALILWQRRSQQPVCQDCLFFGRQLSLLHRNQRSAAPPVPGTNPITRPRIHC